MQVLAYHANRLLWKTSAGDTPVWESLHRAVTFLADYGFQAVMLFFLLSGFLIHLRHPPADFDRLRFFKGRARRLYPALIAALLWTFLLDLVGQIVAPEIYLRPPPLRPFSHDWLTLTGNLLFLQQLAVPIFGTNDPLWSLAYQGWFYVLYALVFLPIYRRIGSHKALGIMLLPSLTGAAIFAFYTHQTGYVAPLTPRWLWHFVGCTGIFFIGAWLADRVADGFRLRRPVWWLIGAAAVMLALMLTHDPLHIYILRDWLWALCFAVILLIAATPSDSPLIDQVKKVLTLPAPLAGSSYTQYLIHYPPIILIRAYFLQSRGGMPSQPWLMIGVVVGSVLVSVLLAQIVERPFASRRG